MGMDRGLPCSRFLHTLRGATSPPRSGHKQVTE